MGSKSIGKILGTVAPIAASFIPGIGPLAAAGIGAASGALSGGGLKGALLGAASSGLGASGVAGKIGGAISNGLGLGGTGALTIGNALTGTATGLATGGGLKSALLGAATGGLGANAGDIANGVFGTPASKPLADGVSGPSTAGTPGLLGTYGSIAGQPISSGGASSFSPSSVTNVLSGIQATNTQDEIEKQLLEAQGRSEAALYPYVQNGANANNALSASLSAGFNPGDLTADPGYQFQLDQGTQAINRSLGANGNVFSGRALQAAQDYGQGLAGTTYDAAYKRWLANNSQLADASNAGLNATGAATQIYDNQGNIAGNATGARSNILNSVLSNVLGGSGARQIVGYKTDGTPIYADEKVSA